MRKTKEDADITKQSILDAAVVVFSEHGVAKSSLEKIAKTANVTRGAVYWHFASKQEIFEALHEQLHTPFIQVITDGVEAVSANAITQLKKVCTEVLIDLEKDEKKKEIATLFLLRCDYSGEFAQSKERFNERKKLKLITLSKYFDKAIEQGVLPKNTDSMLLAIGISAYLRGIAIEYLEDPDTFSMQDNAAKLISMYLGKLQTA
ncbi:MAG: AcrR family transcriptional regulator [Glaciecola sp.]|jgi:AcrR family transcriptional regulator